MIKIKEQYNEEYKGEKQESNILLIEPITLKCFGHVYEELNSDNF